MLEMLLLNNTPIDDSGEYIVTQTGINQTIQWVVPDGVHSICCVCVGNGTFAGGGLSWRNNIPVTPGESLTIIFGISTTNSANGGSTRLLRGSVVLCLAFAGGYAASATPSTANGGAGGKAANAINDGGGNGGRGIRTGADVSLRNVRAGGGAGGYLGAGGNYSLNTTDTSGVAGSGSGGGARVLVRDTNCTGGNVGLHGIGNTGGNVPTGTTGNGMDGSISEVMCGGGLLYTSPDFNGGVRIIWGDGYSYPYNAVEPNLHTNIVPVMTSNTSPAGYVASASAVFDGVLQPWQVFIRDPVTATGQWQSQGYAGASGVINEWLQIQLPEAKVVKRYGIINVNTDLVDYGLHGSDDGVDFTALHTVTNRATTNGEMLLEYDINNTVEYKYYRIWVTKTSPNRYAGIKRLYLYSD